MTRCTHLARRQVEVDLACELAVVEEVEHVAVPVVGRRVVGDRDTVAEEVLTLRPSRRGYRAP